ncbi:MAG: MarR family transcriptional regulator [Acidobacteriota bacterium]|nr:MarR family transcriptional regulator [Acidobacteriota bacterium]
MAQGELARHVEAVRHFSRFYTRKIGILQQGAYHSPFSLTQVRVLYELAHRDQCTATNLCADLGLDAGYLSRILRDFERRGFLQRNRSEADGRQTLLSLSSRGRKAFAPLDERSAEEVGAILGPLSPGERKSLVAALHSVERLFGNRSEQQKSPYLLRTHQPGDMGWVVHRHGVVYAREYGYDEQFEALVADIVAKFIQHFDPRRERCWIAEKDGEIVGSIFLVKKSKTVAKLRLLLVEPSARGLGIGARLVAECVRFARAAGYRKITLWTQSDLYAARHLYEQAGFRLVHKEPHHSFGLDLVAETWDLDFSGTN